ncbi:MAG TPA: hypothetical protein PKL13_03625 [bacterium]|nr:hypothetical protein [bacterium]
MKRNFKLFILLLFLFMIFLVWMTIKQYSSFNLQSISNDVYNIQDSISDMWNKDSGMPEDFSVKDDVDSIKLAIQETLNQKEQNITQATENGIKKQLEEIKIEYIYEPWGITISYFDEMQKSFDEKLQKIIVRYNDNNFLEIKRQTFKEKEFNSWLVKNYDIQDLNKENINNLIFWSTEASKDNFLNKIYIINIEKNIFNIAYRCEINSDYCEKLDQIVKTFNKVK